MPDFSSRPRHPVATLGVIVTLVAAGAGMAAPEAGAQTRRQPVAGYSQFTPYQFGSGATSCSDAGQPTDAPMVALAVTTDGKGCWATAADGGVFTAGDAPFLGSMGGRPLDAPVVGMAATPTGGGYWLVAADGGIFSFGSAPFEGSMGGTPLTAPVVGMATDPATGGYWEAAADGGVFSFDAPFYGSESGRALSRPLPDPATAVAAAPSGGGYLLLATDPAVEPGAPGRSAYALARQQWVGDDALACFEEGLSLFQAAQYLLIGEQEGGTTAGYGAAVVELVQLVYTPEMTSTPTQQAEAQHDLAALSAFFGVQEGYCG